MVSRLMMRETSSRCSFRVIIDGEGGMEEGAMGKYCKNRREVRVASGPVPVQDALGAEAGLKRAHIVSWYITVAIKI